jgi:hypothetical protein
MIKWWNARRAAKRALNDRLSAIDLELGSFLDRLDGVSK